MKKLMAVLLCILLLAAFAGCAASPYSPDAADAVSEQNSAVSPTSDKAYDEAETSVSESADATASGFGDLGLPQPGASSASADKIIYSADAELETRDFDATISSLSELLSKYGGFIESSSVSGSDYYTIENIGGAYRTASFTYRIPADSFNDFCGGVKALGNIPSFNTYAENVTGQYADLDARLSARTAEEQRLLELLDKADTVEEMLQIESALSDVRYEIESLQSSLKDYDTRISYSTLNLRVAEVTLYTKVDDVTKTYGEQLSEGFTATLASVGQFFSNAFKWLISALPVLLIIAAIGLGVFFIVRHIVKKKKAAALPPKEKKE